VTVHATSRLTPETYRTLAPNGSRRSRSARFYIVSENKEPDWSAELAKGGEALWREAELLVRTAERFVRANPFAQRIARAVGADMGELLSARDRPVVHQVTLNATVTPAAATAVATVPAARVETVDFTGCVALAPMRVAGQVMVEDRRSGLAGLSDGEKLALVLVWLFAVALPRVQAALPPDMQAMLSNYYATLGVALIITWRICDKRK
jgi:hypothetical protein